jgi:hypothetical protein
VPTDPEIDRAWAEEARDRLNAYRRGDIEAVTLEEVIASLTPGRAGSRKGNN